MFTPKQPDWIRNVSTGIVGLGYRVNAVYDLAFLTGYPPEKLLLEAQPERIVCFWVLKEGIREVSAEEQLFSHQGNSGPMQKQPVEKEFWLTVRQRDLEELFRMAKKAFGATDGKKASKRRTRRQPPKRGEGA